jgi:hypothetical protein
MATLESLMADTSKTLGACIHKPKLTANLLGKPPFRFLHDIIMEVTRLTLRYSRCHQRRRWTREIADLLGQWQPLCR